MPRMKKPADLRCSQVTAAGAGEFGCSWCGRSSRSGKLYRFRGRDERCWHRGVFCGRLLPRCRPAAERANPRRTVHPPSHRRTPGRLGRGFDQSKLTRCVRRGRREFPRCHSGRSPWWSARLPESQRMEKTRIRSKAWPSGIAVARFGCVLDERSEMRGQRPRYAQRRVFGSEASPDPEQPVI